MLGFTRLQYIFRGVGDGLEFLASGNFAGLVNAFDLGDELGVGVSIIRVQASIDTYGITLVFLRLFGFGESPLVGLGINNFLYLTGKRNSGVERGWEIRSVWDDGMRSGMQGGLVVAVGWGLRP